MSSVYYPLVLSNKPFPNLLSDISQHWACYSTTFKSTLSTVWWKQVHVGRFHWCKQSVWHSGPHNSNKKAWVTC